MRNLAELRKLRNISQKNFAKYLNISQGNLCEWEKGRVEPNIDFLKKIADFFEVSIDYLVGRTDESDYIIPAVSPVLSSDEQAVIDCMRNVGDVEREIITENAKNVYNAYKRNKKAGII